ncbi:hypothetical protein ScalyP_jg8182 [Parmales sp. scaly parma]|nr:hypothetical protein ScalyP_jg8182 [Parmales sp. scaly parma]
MDALALFLRDRLELLEAARDKKERDQVAAREKQEQKERRAQYAAGEREQQAKIEAERIATKARKMAILAESKAKKMKSRWLRFGYLLGKKESVREMWVFSLAFHELWTSRSPSTTPPPEAIISRYVSNWWTSRKTKKFLKKEFVDYLTYYVNQRLGESNQDVFRGYETSMDKIEITEKITPCAIKKIRASEVASVGELAVMKKALEVKCVNVLELHAVVTTDEYVFLAVELCEGCLGRGDFFDTFKLSISERLGLCRQIVVGVNHLHAVGVWHRDIKPGNVLFKQDADNGGLVLKIADMGISKVASEKTLQTVTNASAGTPTYMPCELLNDVEDQGGKVTKERFVAHDMFSLGVLLHYRRK